MKLPALYEQLKKRRVIRAAVVYLALAWLVLQVADLLANAGIIPPSFVRWLIFAAIIGFPLTIILSWVYEAPWQHRKWLAVSGDVVLIAVIAIAASIFAWRQWMTTFTRPTIAILQIVQTDTRTDTASLARHLNKRLRMLLASRPELTVIEPASALHFSLDGVSLDEKFSILGAELLIDGTVNQGDDLVRLSLQLHDYNGNVKWSDRFESRLIDLTALQNSVLNSIWPQLPVAGDALDETRALASDCPYPTSVDAIRTIIDADLATADNAQSLASNLDQHISNHSDNGQLFLSRARLTFLMLTDAPGPRRAVLQRLALQELDHAEEICPDNPEIELSRLYNTLVDPDLIAVVLPLLSRHPNQAELRLKFSEVLQESGEQETAQILRTDALRLDPLNAEPGP